MSGRREAALLAALAAAASLQWGCASHAPIAKREGGATAVAPGAPSARADRGNPPFYDVLGHRYYVLSSSDGYHARGVASWYGRDFHGLATSSGETYNMNALTAAHKTLPIPTWVEVTNLENGKRVVVKVNDRGPFVDDRLIDLSYAAALELDMVRGGTARVEVRALASAAAPASPLPSAAQPRGASSPSAAQPGQPGGASSAGGAQPSGASLSNAVQPAQPRGAAPAAAPSQAGVALVTSADAVAAAPAAAEQALYAQVGAFTDVANAARLVGRLTSSGFPSAFVASEGDARRTLHRVRIGPLQDEHEFDEVRARLRSLGFGESQLVTAQ